MSNKAYYQIGAGALLAGSVLLAIYNISFFSLLPFHDGKLDRLQAFLNPNWLWITFLSFLGILLLMAGFFSVFFSIKSSSGLIGVLGILFVELAYAFQLSKVSWELFLYRPIAENAAANILISEGILFQDKNIIAFKIVSSIIIFLGLIFFCTALLRSKLYSRVSASFIFIGALIYGLGPIVGSYYALWGILIFCLGSLLLALQLFKLKSIAV